MNSRELILTRLRAAVPAAVEPPATIPDFEEHWPADWNAFVAKLKRMGGELADGDTRDLAQWLRTRFPDAKVVCSATPEVQGNRALGSVTEPAQLKDVDVAVVRARLGVAETGSVLLSEQDFGINVLGYLAQRIVILLDPRDLVGNLHQAYERTEFREAHYCVLMTGPSATADIEGTLVHGAQGVRSLSLVARARPTP